MPHSSHWTQALLFSLERDPAARLAEPQAASTCRALPPLLTCCPGPAWARATTSAPKSDAAPGCVAVAMAQAHSGSSRMVGPHGQALLPASPVRRLGARRGAKKAIIAVAASLLTVAWQMLRDGTEWHDVRVTHFLTAPMPPRPPTAPVVKPACTTSLSCSADTPAACPSTSSPSLLAQDARFTLEHGRLVLSRNRDMHWPN